jgi:hypothetical protein
MVPLFEQSSSFAIPIRSLDFSQSRQTLERHTWFVHHYLRSTATFKVTHKPLTQQLYFGLAAHTKMPANQPTETFPLGFDEIERLVKSLADPGNAKKISQNEATLRVLQRSPQGWEIADALLKSDDEQVRFFGALTLTIKLNADT